jgi:hypothetical protein
LPARRLSIFSFEAINSIMKNPRMRNARHLSAQARVTLLCGVLALIGIQIGLPMIAGSDNSAVRDPLYEIKLAKLRERLQEHPQRPLILVLGSSRPAAGIRPDLWQGLAASDRTPMVFNFAMPGAGPRQQLIYLRRILAEGIHPAAVMIEILPALLNQADNSGEDYAIKTHGLQAEELASLADHDTPLRSSNSDPSSESPSYWSSLRLRVLRRFAPAWVETDVSSNATPEQFTLWGWRPFAEGVQVATAEERRRGFERARSEYAANLADWKVTPVADRAVRRMLEICRQEQMSAALYLMPEGTDYRAMYRPDVRAALNDYLAAMTQDCGVPVFDATECNADQDFWDGHHLLANGATRFTQRFCHEFLDDFAANLSEAPRLSQGPANDRR